MACALWIVAWAYCPNAGHLTGAQEQEEELPPANGPAKEAPPDALLPRVVALAATVTKPDVNSLTQAFQNDPGVSGGKGAPPNTLTSLGDLEGEGVPEMVLRAPLQDLEADYGGVPAPDLPPLWNLYLLSWNGTNWQASPLASGVGDFTVRAISLGQQGGAGIALVTEEGNPATTWPSVFQVRDHAAVLLWDSQADESRYEPLLGGHMDFQSRGNAAADMVITGRADPGLLQFDPAGRRGFSARAIYHWDGKAYIPSKTVYSPCQDYTLYRFIAALHLRDFRSAYAWIVPGQFLHTHSPTLDTFRDLVRETWPEFLANNVFRAGSMPAGSPEEYTFELSLPEKHYLYRPTFSTDGKFLLTGLQRSQETLPAEPVPLGPQAVGNWQ